VSNNDGIMYFTNNRYNITTEVNAEEDNFRIDTVVNRRVDRILKTINFDSQNDTILFVGKSNIILLKEKEPNLNQYRVINLYDSVLAKFPYEYWVENFYRKIHIDKKHKTYIINDLIPFKNKFLQKIEYNETDYNAVVDPTDFNDIIFYYPFYKGAIERTKDTYLYLLGKKNLDKKNPFELMYGYFTKDSLLNYNAANLAERKSYNYYSQFEKGLFLQALATYFSLADDLHKSDSVWRTYSNSQDTCFCEIKGNELDLIETIKGNQVVMFNEAHHIPLHRALVLDLLDSLYSFGFRHLALEAFVPDSVFETKGYVSADNGLYLCEPNFANLVRKAHKLGFNVFGYDDMAANRDSMQAVNIFNNTIKQDSSAKIVALAGWGHISKNAMAGYFEKIAKIKPFTIDQTVAYNYCVKDSNSVYIFKHQQGMRGVDADLYLFNNLNLNKKHNIEIKIPEEIMNQCAVISLYEQNEFNYLRAHHKFPLPVSVKLTYKSNMIGFQMTKGIYVAVLQDRFGYVLKKYVLTIR
jgi:hypothetical protein